MGNISIASPSIPSIKIKLEQEEKDIYFSALVSRKPWLACIPVKSLKLANLKKQFTIEPEDSKAPDLLR